MTLLINHYNDRQTVLDRLGRHVLNLDVTHKGGSETPGANVIKLDLIRSCGSGDSDLDVLRKNTLQINAIVGSESFSASIGHNSDGFLPVGYGCSDVFPDKVIEIGESHGIPRCDVDSDMRSIRIPIIRKGVEFDSEKVGTITTRIKDAEVASNGTIGDCSVNGCNEEGDAVTKKIIARAAVDSKCYGSVEDGLSTMFPELNWLGVQDSANTLCHWQGITVYFCKT